MGGNLLHVLQVLKWGEFTTCAAGTKVGEFTTCTAGTKVGKGTTGTAGTTHWGRYYRYCRYYTGGRAMDMVLVRDAADLSSLPLTQWGIR